MVNEVLYTNKAMNYGGQTTIYLNMKLHKLISRLESAVDSNSVWFITIISIQILIYNSNFYTDILQFSLVYNNNFYTDIFSSFFKNGHSRI